jgi:hypothetical protein
MAILAIPALDIHNPPLGVALLVSFGVLLLYIMAAATCVYFASIERVFRACFLGM